MPANIVRLWSDISALSSIAFFSRYVGGFAPYCYFAAYSALGSFDQFTKQKESVSCLRNLPININTGEMGDTKPVFRIPYSSQIVTNVFRIHAYKIMGNCNHIFQSDFHVWRFFWGFSTKIPMFGSCVHFEPKSLNYGVTNVFESLSTADFRNYTLIFARLMDVRPSCEGWNSWKTTVWPLPVSRLIEAILGIRAEQGN